MCSFLLGVEPRKTSDIGPLRWAAMVSQVQSWIAEKHRKKRPDVRLAEPTVLPVGTSLCQTS